MSVTVRRDGTVLRNGSEIGRAVRQVVRVNGTTCAVRWFVVTDDGGVRFHTRKLAVECIVTMADRRERLS